MTKPIIGIGTDVHAVTPRRDRVFAYTTYIESLRQAGAVPVLIPPQPENAADVIDSLDGVLLAGGADCDPALYGEERHSSVSTMDPRRQTNDFTLARVARERGLPTLGICLGLQMMTVASGGKLIQDIPSEIDTTIAHSSSPNDRSRHDVVIEEGTRLASILGSRTHNVNSSHHQAIRTVGDGMRVTAHAPDGIIEGVEDPKHPFYVGVQWHPEDMPGEESATAIFRAFVEAAREHAARKKA